MKFFIVTILMGMMGSVAMAGELTQRTYTFKTYSRDFTCYAGTAPNGHNYPTDTLITFDTGAMIYGIGAGDASGIYAPSLMPLNNTDRVRLHDGLARPCSSYASLLNNPGEIQGKATQHFSTTLKRTSNGECFKMIREDLNVVIAGYEFSGSNITAIPMEDTDCPS